MHLNMFSGRDDLEANLEVEDGMKKLKLKVKAF